MAEIKSVAMIYRKELIHTDEKDAYIFIPYKAMTGKLNDETKLFECDGLKFASMNDNLQLATDDTLYYGDVRDLRKLPFFLVGNHTRNFYEVRKSSILMKVVGEDGFERFNIEEEVVRYLNNKKEKKEETIDENSNSNEFSDANEEIRHYTDLALSKLEESNDIFDIILASRTYAFLRALYYHNVPFGSKQIKKEDLNEETLKYLESKIKDIQSKIEEKGIIFEEYTEGENDLSQKENGYALQKREQKEVVDNKTTFDPNKKVYPEYSFDDIYNGITDVVIDQDEHIEKIVSVLYKRLIELGNIDPDKRGKFGMMVTGNTGVGKSEIFKTFASIVDLPIQFMDATQLSAEGYVGRNIDDYLSDLLRACNGDVEKASKAFTILDEVDKANSSNVIGKDVSGKAVQDMFLKFMDGTDYNVVYNRMYHKMNSSNMTPISMGAFSDLYRNLHTNDLGFGGTLGRINSVTLDDFIKYGMSDEFMGRHQILIHLNDLNVESLLKIMEKSKKSPLRVQSSIYETLGIEAIFTEEYKKAIAERALERKIGARALTGCVEETTYLPIREIDKNRGSYNKVIFTEETVNDPKRYILRRD